MIYGDRTTTFDDFLKKNNDEYTKTLMSIEYIDRMMELAATANSCYILFIQLTTKCSIYKSSNQTTTNRYYSSY